MLLAFETSTRTPSVALVESAGGVVRSVHAKEPRALAELVRECVGSDLSAVEAYAISVGPGSFTGLRIGVAFLKGLAAVHARPAIPVSSLMVWAASATDLPSVPERWRWVTLDARREQAFAGAYRVDGAGGWTACLEDTRMTAAQLRTHLEGASPGDWVGDADVLAPDAPAWKRSEVRSPSAEVLGVLAWAAHRRGEMRRALDVEPNYLMLSAAEEKLGDSA